MRATDGQERSTTARGNGYPVALRAVLLLGKAYSRLYHHLSVPAACPLPKQGPAILVCNHIAGVDPVLVQSACPRLVTWMMAREYYDLRAMRWFFRRIGAIPVQRSGRDLSATREALRALEQGRILGVFPEGRISTTEDLLPFQTGVALIAIKTGVEVYPAHMEGTQRGREMLAAFALPCRAVLRFGPAVPLDRSSTSREALQATTQRIRDAVMALRQQTRRELGRPA